jgi:hypothetical protein
MSHFLARLVERARGTAARVEPLITPRFAPTPIVEIASEVEAPSPERRDQQPKVEKVSSPRAIIQEEAPGEKTAQQSGRQSEKSSVPPQPEKLLVPMDESVVRSMIFVRPSPSGDRQMPALKNGMVKRNSVATSRSKRAGRAIPLATTPRDPERDLFTPNESPEQPPIVRVTIGRIDVRATPPVVPLRKSSTRSEPKLTLDAYLKSRKEGTR